MTKITDSVQAKMADFAAKTKVDGATGAVEGKYSGTSGVRDVAEERRLAAAEAAKRRVLDRPLA